MVIYGLYNFDVKVFSCISIGNNDVQVSDAFLTNTFNVLNEFYKKGEVIDEPLNSLMHSCFCKLGEIDLITGDLKSKKKAFKKPLINFNLLKEKFIENFSQYLSPELKQYILERK